LGVRLLFTENGCLTPFSGEEYHGAASCRGPRIRLRGFSEKLLHRNKE